MFNPEKITKYSKILILFIIGLIPLLWFKDGLLINGSDIDFPLNPIYELFCRAQAWDEVYQGGRNNVLNFCTLVFAGIRALPYLVTQSLIVAEKFSFVFWFMFSVFSMYYLLDTIILKNEGFLLKLLVCLFYQLNFYQLVCWAEVHIAGVVALAITPAMVAVVAKIIKGESLFKNVVLFCILSFFSSGIWVNPPTAIITSVIVASCTIFYLIESVRERGFGFIKTLAIRCILMCSLYLLINAYALIPLADTFFMGGAYENTVEDFNVIGCLKFACAYSSPLNVMRLMGRADIYSSYNQELYYPFFEKYVMNRYLIAGSFILPFLAFSSLLFYKKDKRISFYFCMAMVGIILSIGIHQPVGKLYVWLVKHIPLFYLFRQPWMKFAFLTAFAYPILAGIGIKYWKESIIRYFAKRSMAAKYLCDSIILIVMLAYVFFMRSFVLGEMYAVAEKRKALNPLHIKIPEYVFDTGIWLNSEKNVFSVAMLPEEKANVYKWGYRGIADVLVRVSDKMLLYDDWGEMGDKQPLVKMYNLFMRGMRERLTTGVSSLLNMMGVRYVIQRNDIMYYFYGDKESPSYMKEQLAGQKGIVYKNSFGKWDVYENILWKDNFISSYANSCTLSDYSECLLPISENISFFPRDTVFLTTQNREMTTYVNDLKNEQKISVSVNPAEQILPLYGNKGLLFHNLKGLDAVNKLDKIVYFLKDGVYKIRVKLRPKFKETIVEGGSRTEFKPNDIINWAYKANNVEYDNMIEKDNLDINIVFDGKGDEDEYLQIKKEGFSVDLEERPLFIMEYELSGSQTQFIEFIFGLDFDGDGKPDEYLRGIRTNGVKRFQVNLFDEVFRRVRAQKTYKIVMLEVYCHKMWGVDCVGDKEPYKFSIKSVRFSDEKKRLAVELHKRKVKIGKKEMEKLSAKYDLRHKRLFMRVPVGKVDLMMYPEISVKYRVRPPAKAEKLRLFFKLVHKKKSGVGKLVYVGGLPLSDRFEEHRFNVLQIKDKTQLWENFFLTGIEFRVSGKNMRGDIKDIFKLRGVSIFNSTFTDRNNGPALRRQLVKVGGKIITLRGMKEGERFPQEMIVSEEISVKKGAGRLEMLLDDDSLLECQWILVTPEYKINNRITSPDVSYKRVNQTAYKIEAKNINSSFILAMNNNYDHKWRLYIRGDNGTRREIGKHFIANGYANGWLVNDLRGDADLEILYYPQQLFQLGLKISAGILIVLCVISIRRLLK